ncbi:chromosome segregation protein SMC [Anaerolinea thermophila]|uniref:chromosome segregation protein SMC n=2 Tax=Anaerolinea TaxID=233189 RepID=UPI0026F306E9|nr:chromosome segregation protein SMC [Anaerolinea thermophila]
MPLLKSLELHGYKTFASRTLFEFPGMVTAIVGPNGSGKSNIADAVRWVLGEQSFSLLRGRKTEDMIFSGSELRPRAGMASASILFDNESGWLPIDYSEVLITRRAYRDGSNEYLLNGQRVRLKEITELLAQSGLAERTYTIIGQGLVDAALSLKPEERRRFFEEAAGIGLYRSRREEALHRLDTTRRNLERVLDILSELEPRLNSLEKQARRAMEYEQIRADLRLLLRDWYGYHWHRVQRELTLAREALLAQEERFQQARDHLLEEEQRSVEIRQRLNELRESLGMLHRQSAEAHARWEEFSKRMAVLEERQRALVDQRQRTRNDLERMEEEDQARLEKRQSLEEELTRLQEEQKEAEERMREARKALEARQAERNQLEARLRDARRLQTQAETRQVQVRAHHTELLHRIENLQSSVQSLQQALKREQDDLQRAQGLHAQWERNRAQAEEARKKLEEGLRTHQQTLRTREEERRALQEERNRLEAEATRLRAQLEVLEQAERTYSGLAEGARFLLQESRQKRLPGVFQAMSSHLIVPAAYEQAIAAALGELVNAVLVEGVGDLDAVLTALLQGEKGRAVLVPLEHARVGEGLTDVANETGVIGVAAQLVQATPSLRAVVDLLLGQVLLVEDRATARRMAERIPPQARVVTLQGEVFFGNGVIVAGRESRGGASPIGRARRLQELRAAIEEKQTHLEQVQSDLRTLEAEITRLREQEKELDRQVREANQALTRATQSLQQAALEVEQIRQRQEYQKKQLAGLEAQIEKAQAEAAQEAQTLQEISRTVEQTAEQVRLLNRSLSALPLEEMQAEVAHWNTRLAVAQRAVNEAHRRLEEHRQAEESARRQREVLSRRLGEVDVLLGELEAEKAQVQEQSAEIGARIEALRTRIEPAEAQVRQLEQEAAEQQNRLIAAQQATAVAERHVNQAQLELSRQREALDSLRRKVEDDFGIVAFEYQGEAGQAPLPLEGMVEQLPSLSELPAELEENINRQRALLRRMGPINPEVQNEYRAVKERYDFLKQQVADLTKADEDLRKVIAELDDLMKREFRKTFDAVAYEFRHMFTRLFGGGSARLILTEGESTADMGIDIEARLPGRRDQGLSLLSGGERSLTAVALIFSLLKVSPTPFCIMDEVDAMLDEANVGRFRDLLLELAQKTQFILITHNRNTVQAANVIYGVTMGRDSASQVISLRLDELSEELVK